MGTVKGFIKDWAGRRILPITRAELILDQDGNPAFTSKYFEAGYNGNEYGLISASERALITGGSTGQGISDIYAKLGQINTGLYFNDAVLKFYDNTGAATPIKVGSVGDGRINISLDGNNVNLSLEDIKATNTISGSIIKNITVDAFGRVVAVSGGDLTNAEIPGILTGKTLSGCTTTSVGSDDNSIPNKAYVDQKFAESTGIATGALRFKGSLNSADAANAKLTNSSYLNDYYKVSGEFDISSSDIYEYSGDDTSVTVKIGDTLIIYAPTGTTSRAKFVHIPTGDDITTITVKGDSNTSDAITHAVNNVKLRFSSPFNVINDGLSSAYVELKAASSDTDGYLSKEDYIKFANYNSALRVVYSGTFDSESAENGLYKLGTLTIGGSSKNIIAKNNISNLSLSSTTDNVPVIKFTETGVADVDIAFKSSGGINITKNNNDVEFAAANTVTPTSNSYLKITDGYKFGVILGSIDESNQVTEGLVNFGTVHQLALQVAKTTIFEEIDYKLSGDPSKTYQYGEKLAEYVNIDI